ncbi:MAG: hypothetical protein JSW05_00765 [Candidatus Thorarchaeota archaeon]|nr:MAG: hypothetical protein JSW05_00765 [Candidatus Thorarchaeota archaeon]
MQDLVAIAALLREVSFGVLIVGLFYTFGMFLVGRLFSAIAEHGVEHDVDHDVEHDVDHDYDVDHEVEVDHDVDHEIDHDYDADYDSETGYDHEIGHEVEKEIDHDMDHELDHDVEHDVEKDWDHEVEKEIEHYVEKDIDHHDADHDVDIDHELEAEKHSGFFESERGAPLGVTIGTSLVSFGFLGSILYYDGLMLPFAGKLGLHVMGALFTVVAVRTVLGKVFVEAGFLIEPRHLVGRQVEAVSTVNDHFGEIRTETDMGLRRFHARPFQKGVSFEKGTILYVVSANEKFAFVDPRKEVVKWQQKQSRRVRELETET